MKTIYVCEICDREYDTEEEAMQCESQGLESPILPVGSFVLTHPIQYGRFGWFNGNKDWIIQAPRGLHSKKDWDSTYYNFIYVITAVTYNKERRKGHIPRYHLATRAMTKETGNHGGYTYPETHLKMIEFSPSIELDVSNLIGNTFKGSL